MEVTKMAEELFEVLVAKHFRAGMNKRDAIMEAMQEDPEAHERYIDRVNSGGHDFLKEIFCS
jgi:uncharacterized Ntn-hydrolase superfamily protein